MTFRGSGDTGQNFVTLSFVIFFCTEKERVGPMFLLLGGLAFSISLCHPQLVVVFTRCPIAFNVLLSIGIIGSIVFLSLLVCV
jgi:hypothetical protein